MFFLGAAKAFIAIGVLGAGLIAMLAAWGGILKYFGGEAEPDDGPFIFRIGAWGFVLTALGLLFCHWAFEVGA